MRTLGPRRSVLVFKDEGGRLGLRLVSRDGVAGTTRIGAVSGAALRCRQLR